MFDFLNGTYVLFIVSFLIFMALLNELLLKPVGKVVEARAAKITRELEAGKQAHKEAADLLKHYEDKLKEIRQQAQHLVGEAAEEATKTRAAEVSKVQGQGKARMDQARKDIDAEREALKPTMVGEEKDLAVLIARKVIGDDNATIKFDADQDRRILEGAF